MNLRVLTCAAAVALLTVPALAAEPHANALAAGYKAGFLCSGIFVAGRTEAQATADDLKGIYPEYQAIVDGFAAVVDRSVKRVSVAYDPNLPPRIAEWRPVLGCSQLPIGAAAGSVALPRVVLTPPDLAATDALPWPRGDAGAAAGPPTPAVAAAVAKAFDRAAYGAASETTAVIVLVDGRIVAERYRPDFTMHTPQRTWSVAKSLTATLLGRADQLGWPGLFEPAAVPEWRAPGDPRAAITNIELLRMASGLATGGPGNRTDEVYLGGATVPATAATMPLEAAPGTRFRYANNDMLLAAYSLRNGGGYALEFPFTRLLWPLGMTRTTPETDWQGNFILSSQVWMTARDMARLALVYANDGIADGERLLPEGWSKFVAAPAGPQPAEGPGYGAGFWLFGTAQGLPAGSYAMQGNRGQYVMIVPGRVIVVRRGFDAAGVRFDIASFTRDVLAALAR